MLTHFFFMQHIWDHIFSAMALLALLVAAVGVYGVTAYAVSRRRREMGVRVALGADPGALLGLVVRQGLVLAVVGVGLGLLLAWPLVRALGDLLSGVSTTDPVIFVTVTGVLLGVGALASYLPARRASQVDPIVVLRDE